MPIKLFYAPGSCSLAPHVVLEWIGHPYELVRVRYGSPELVAVNPAGAVPVLDTGEGWTLTQVAAILVYLAGRFPEAALGGDGSLRAKAEIARWASFFGGDLHPAFYPIFSPARYTKATEEAALEAVRLAGQDLVRKKLALLDGHLKGRRTMVGERRSVIDAYALPLLRWAEARLPDQLKAYPNVARHLDMMRADPAVGRVMASEQIT